MEQITQELAEQLYSVGTDIYVSDSTLPEDMQKDHAVRLNVNEQGGEMFSSLMRDWYVFNHWGNKKPKPIFFKN